MRCAAALLLASRLPTLQLKRDSRRWKANEANCLEAMYEDFGVEPAGWFWTVPPRGSTHYIVVDGVREGGGIDWGPWHQLTVKIVQALTTDLTSLCITTIFSKWDYQSSIAKARVPPPPPLAAQEPP